MTAAPGLLLAHSCSCVFDTNVVLELYSLHDLTRLYNQKHAVHGETTEDLPEVMHRRERAADTLALAIALHETQAQSFHLVSEALALLEKRVPHDSSTFERAYTGLFIHYIKDYCLADWGHISWEELGVGVTGDDCDELLLDVARANTLPLITNEGNKVGGIDESHGLRGRARALGVRVYTPGEYVATLGVAFPAASQAFANRFKNRQSEYLAKRPHDDHEFVREHLMAIGNIYQWCFNSTGNRKP